MSLRLIKLWPHDINIATRDTRKWCWASGNSALNMYSTEVKAEDRKYSTRQFQVQKTVLLVTTTSLSPEIVKANILKPIKLFKLAQGKFFLTVTVCILLFLTKKKSFKVSLSKHNQGFLINFLDGLQNSACLISFPMTHSRSHYIMVCGWSDSSKGTIQSPPFEIVMSPSEGFTLRIMDEMDHQLNYHVHRLLCPLFFAAF